MSCSGAPGESPSASNARSKSIGGCDPSPLHSGPEDLGGMPGEFVLGEYGLPPRYPLLPPWGKQLGVDLDHALDVVAPRVACGALARERTQLGAARRVEEGPRGRGPRLAVVERVEGRAGLPLGHELGDPSTPAHDRRYAAREPLEHRAAERVEAAREEHQVGGR